MVKCLTSSDWVYEGNYDNSDDSTNTKTARGWNYHQGPVSIIWNFSSITNKQINFSKKI